MRPKWSEEAARARQQELIDASTALVALAEGQDRELTVEEGQNIDANTAEFDRIEAEIQRRGKIAAQTSAREQAEAELRRPQPRKTEPDPIAGDDGRLRRGAVMFKDTINGRDIRGFRHGEAIARNQLEAAPGDIVRSLLLNDTASLPERIRNSLSTGSGTGGGYLLSPEMSSIFVDLARSASVVSRAGAITVPLDASETRIARLTSDATATWRQETASIGASTPSFDQIVLRPKTVAALVPVSIELLEDAPNAGTVISTALANALGLALDRAALVGSGAAAEPLGIRNHTSVNTLSSIGTPADYTDLTAAVGDILAANYPGEISALAWVQNPREGERFDGLVTGITSDKTPLQPTPWVAQLRRLYTTSLPITEGAGAESSMILGDFRELVIGMRTTGVSIEVLDAGTATDASAVTWNATDQMLRFVRAYLRADIALLRPTWFTVLTGVTNT